MDARLEVEMGFVQRRLPWLIACGALVFYVASLERFATFAGIAVLAKAAGWDWHLNLVSPLHVILTFPVRWLPPAAQLWGLNLTAAVAASAALGLLARSVSLLPHDRTHLQRAVECNIPDAWVPPVLAALVCGLQLTFWENAVVATGEALDLLIFAWLVNCLLEYRLDRKASRLGWFAFVYGLGVANNYAMIGLFPAFLTAFIWIVGRSLLQWRLLFRTTLCGAAGLILYLLLPVLTRLSDPDGTDLWTLLRSYWAFQWTSLNSMPRYVILLCSLTSLVPVGFMGILWRGRTAEVSAAGKALNDLMTHIIHGVFLVACVYVAFDPVFSPRSLAGGRFALLPLYLLGALAIGYFSGYFLLVLRSPGRVRRKPLAATVRLMASRASIGLIWIAVAAIGVGLLVKNRPVIADGSSRAMSHLSRAAADSLPAEGALVLSDDPFQLYSLQHELLKMNPRHRHMLVHTTALTSSDYHRFLHGRYPDRWPPFLRPPDRGTPVDAGNLINVLLQIDQRAPIYYLHPSFGVFFEYFYARPDRMAYKLVRYPTNSLTEPALAPSEIQRQDKYLTALGALEFGRLIEKVRSSPDAAGRGKGAPKSLDTYLGEVYARVLDDFGVHAQRAGDTNRAAACFDRALQLNPLNVAAYINRAHTEQLRKGRTDSAVGAEIMDRLKPFQGRWDLVLEQDGPLDEPFSCHRLAQGFAETGHYRQAGRELERVFSFAPESRSARLDHMMMCIRTGIPDQALAAAEAYRARYQDAGFRMEEELELLRVEAWAQALKKNLPGAERLLQMAQAKYPEQSLPWDTLVEIYLRLGRETDALLAMEKQLRAQPRNVKTLVNYGGLKMRLGGLPEALASLNRALEIESGNDDGRFNRALVNAALQRWDAAQSDFQALVNGGNSKHRLKSCYGLAEIHFRKKNRAESLRYFQEFLKGMKSAGIATTPELQQARERIRTLESETF